MKLNLMVHGKSVQVEVPSLKVGQFVHLRVDGRRISLYWDGVKLVLPTLKADVAQPVEQTEPEFPAWVFQSDDPRIQQLRDEAEGDYSRFRSLLARGAWSQALLYQGMKKDRNHRFGYTVNGLDARAFEAYARHAADANVPMPDDREIVEATAEWAVSPEDVVVAKELASEGDYMSFMVTQEHMRRDDFGQDGAQVHGSDVDVINQLLRHAGKASLPDGSYLVKADKKRQILKQCEHDLALLDLELEQLAKQHGSLFVAAQWAMEYAYHHGQTALRLPLWQEALDLNAQAEAVQAEMDALKAQAKVLERRIQYKREAGLPLADVLATIKANWDGRVQEIDVPLDGEKPDVAGGYSMKQKKFIERLIGRTHTWEEVEVRKFTTAKRGKVYLPVLVIHKEISTLFERANSTYIQWLIDEAIGRGEGQQAAHDEDAHPADTEPVVQVSLDNQARFLDWVGRKVEEEKVAQAKPKGAKPWLSRPSYLHVLSAALANGARTPAEAHNRAYAADTLRLPDRILGMTDDGFQVMLNRDKGQVGLVSLADARVAYPFLPVAAKDRMKELAVKQ